MFKGTRYVHKTKYTFINYFSNYRNKSIRVRFAPSPTGYLHLGGLRTALYNFLFAKANNGTFLLRIEDTDQSRIVPGATDQLIKDLEWSGIEINEGPNKQGSYGPYIQSQRLDLYKKHVHILLNNGSAYPCFCTDKRLDLLRKEALKKRQVPKYDNHCRSLSFEERIKKLKRKEKHCIRFQLTPNCETFEDLIFGNIAYDVGIQEGDPVIIKSDGYPTYHFANVVDDHLMDISHVLRGVEWQISTTKHILLYRAFHWKPPKFGHLPLLMNPDGTKLSKRQGDIRIENYRKKGILPQALINFITTSGGGFENNTSISNVTCYSMSDLAKQFNLKKISVNSGKLMPERLNDFNRAELKRQLKDNILKLNLIKNVKNIILNKFSEKAKDNSLQIDDDYISTTLNWALPRINSLEDIASKHLAFLWITPNIEEVENYNLDVIKLLVAKMKAKNFIFNEENLKKFIKDFATENNIPFTEFMKIMRSILSGLKEGPGVVEMIQILGKENTIKRIENYVNNYSQFS